MNIYGNIIIVITTSINERTHLFIKIYLSHFILERVMFLVYEWWVGDRDILLYWPHVLLTIAALFPHLGWGCSIVGHGEPKALSLQAGSHASISYLQLTPTAPGTWLYYCLTSTCFRCSSAYLRRCISWLTVRSRVNI